MIYVKNRLIFGLVGKIIKLVLKTVYKFLSFFNLHITMFVAVVGAILYFTGVLTSHRTILLVFYVLLIGSVIYAIFSSVKKLLGLGKKVEKKGSVQIVERDTDQNVSVQEQTVQEQTVQSTNQSVLPQIDPSKPIRYFAVKDNPSVVVAEYDNRYVLYYKTQSGFKYVRTDFKG